VGRVGVVVPLLNEALILPQLLQYLGQCGADELVLVDGGSEDGSRQLLEHSGFRWLTSEPGRAAQMNAGAAACRSEIILFLHVDTKIASSHVKCIREAMHDVRVLGGRFDVRLSGKGAGLRLIEWFINLRSKLSRISTGDQAMFVRRDVFEAMGGFADMPLMEDIEFSQRLKRQGKIVCLSQTVRTSSRRWEQHGIARTVLLMWRLRLLFWLGIDAEKLAAMYRQTR